MVFVTGWTSTAGFAHVPGSVRRTEIVAAPDGESGAEGLVPTIASPHTSEAETDGIVIGPDGVETVVEPDSANTRPLSRTSSCPALVAVALPEASDISKLMGDEPAIRAPVGDVGPRPGGRPSSGCGPGGGPGAGAGVGVVPGDVFGVVVTGFVP